MYLSNKQLVQLISPFIIALILYIYDDDIMQNTNFIFPSIKEYSNQGLDTSANYYLKIQRNKDEYLKIKDKLELRNKSAKWIIDKLSYEGKISKEVPDLENNTSVKKPSIIIWTLEAIFPKEKVAIINSTIVKEGASINGAKVMKINDNNVSLKTSKGFKWVSLFQ